jgi:ligand-binding sensor domain-containing protein
MKNITKTLHLKNNSKRFNMVYKSYKYLLISVIINMFVMNIFSQGTWKIYTKEDGLSTNNITEILEDSKGNLWFNPPIDDLKKVMTKFDGKDWMIYGTWNKKLDNRLATVSVFYEDNNGAIWFGSNFLGLVRIKETIFERIKIAPTKFIIEGFDGKIWFGAKKLYSYDGEEVLEYSKKVLGGKKITAIHSDNSGNIWIGTKTGVAVYHGHKWETFSEVSNAPTEVITSIISDSQGNIWIGGEEGVFKYDGVNWQHFTTKDGLVGNETLMIRIGARNTIFAIAGIPEKEFIGLIGMGSAIKSDIARKGMSIFKDGHWKAYTEIPGVPKNIISKSLLYLQSVFIEDNSGNMWFNGKENTIYKFDGSAWKSFNESNGFTGKRFFKMIEDRKGNHWFSIAKGIAKYDGNNWFYFNKDTGLPSNRISSIIEDKQGNIWFGTYRGVVKYTPE